VELARFRIEPLATKISVTGLPKKGKQKGLVAMASPFCGEPMPGGAPHDSSAR
jgi:hypothetical protein